jgi:DNA-directed RNA polymerase specialized sigma24 family protein
VNLFKSSKAEKKAGEQTGHDEPMTSHAPVGASAFALADPLLLPWLTAENEALAQQLLNQLLVISASPIIRSIVGRKFPVHQDGDPGLDREDIVGEVLLRLLKYLRLVKKERGSALPPENFANYVASITHHYCAEYLRQRYPQRRRLRDQLRYILTRQAEFALWMEEQAIWLCGFATWKATRRKAEVGFLLASLRQNPQLLVQSHSNWQSLPSQNLQSWSLIDLLAAIFTYTGNPLELNALLTLTAEIKGIKDYHDVSVNDVMESEGSHLLAASMYDIGETQINQRLYLQEMWGAIRQLPLPNRIALLLNLHDAG